MGNVNRKRELNYLSEDLVKDLSILANNANDPSNDWELLAQIRTEVDSLPNMDLGVIQVLNSIQYLLAELRIDKYEGDWEYILTTKMIDDVQDFLDWRDSWS